MKVLIFHQYFGTSQDAGGGTRTYELGRRLVRRGDSVTIVTGNASYFSGKKTSQGKGFWSRERVEGIDVVRVHIPFGGSRRILPRIIGFLWFIPMGLLAGCFADAPEVVVATSTPLTIGIPGYLLSRLRRVPFVLELRDLWPDCVVAWDVVRDKLLIRAGYWLEAFLYRKAQKILAVTEGIRQELLRKGIAPEKVSVITNASDIDLFTPSGARADLAALAEVPSDAFVCIHSGSLGFSNCVEFLLDVAEELKDVPRIHFIILGAGPQKAWLVAEADRRELRAVHFLQAVPKTQVPGFLRSVQLGIAAFRPSPLTYIFLPNKFFDYLACGLPVMVNFDGEARQHLEQANAGIYTPPDNPAACAQAIRELASSPERAHAMAGNARRLAETCFSWEHKAVEFRSAICSATSKQSQVLPSMVQTQ
ncbi:MAG: glycosyltransferase family 4 protein [Terriglobales bacterium]